MWCPECQHEHTRVAGTDKAFLVTRYRVCEKCGYRFTTYELHDYDPDWQPNAKYAREELDRLLKKRRAFPEKHDKT